LLLVTTGSFYPPYHGDSVRLNNMIAWFRRAGWRVYVVHWHSHDHRFADYRAMDRLCDGLSVYYPGPSWQGSSSGACDDWCPDGLQALVARVCCDRRPDVVIAQYVFLSKCLLGLPGPVVKVLDADNIFSGRRELFENAGFGYDWFSTSPAQERVGLSRADLLISVQEVEAGKIARLVPDRPVVLVPPAERAVAVGGDDSDDLLFVSSPDPVNMHGIRWFIDEALPEIRRRHPGTRLLVAGGVADDLPELPGVVQRLGVVPDIRPLYDRCCIVLNTTAFGTGIKSKTVRALCHGKCLVSTSSGIDGLERYTGICHVADTPRDFAAVICRLLGDRGTVRATGQRALAFASRYFDPDIVFGRLEHVLLAHQARVRPGRPGRSDTGTGSSGGGGADLVEVDTQRPPGPLQE
jgi:glycosyltransferase involved in cell wall biosynthesis